MDTFWSAFWPNLAATLVGVVLGVPIALWLNGLAGRGATRSREALERELLRNGLEVTESAISHNREQLKVLLDIIKKNQALFELKVDTAAWEASRDQVAPLLRRPDLHRRIAYHFLRMSQMARLTGLYLDMVAGVPAAVGGIEHSRAALRNHLTTSATELIADAEGLIREIADVLQSARG